ncbi:hypothetical protein MHPYR_160067 [uncultured Mycobacterium sp.]|uniref:Uncharacterized protein n=1 Tax=uncultured Mycobacterium sp. TaxID=171292 RepID=A0A1Y5P3L6_9MYCO|nr:hypothetical protein MHPYR_160067 [uncultured Mycobacterium sp.]
MSGTTPLRNAEFQRLTQLRESRAREIKTFYTEVTHAASIVTHGTQTIAAANEFTKAFNEHQPFFVSACCCPGSGEPISAVWSPRRPKAGWSK